MAQRSPASWSSRTAQVRARPQLTAAAAAMPAARGPARRGGRAPARALRPSPAATTDLKQAVTASLDKNLICWNILTSSPDQEPQEGSQVGGADRLAPDAAADRRRGGLSSSCARGARPRRLPGFRGRRRRAAPGPPGRLGARSA
jgi:hypothetical protein